MAGYAPECNPTCFNYVTTCFNYVTGHRKRLPYLRRPVDCAGHAVACHCEGCLLASCGIQHKPQDNTQVKSYPKSTTQKLHITTISESKYNDVSHSCVNQHNLKHNPTYTRTIRITLQLNFIFYLL